MKKSNINSNDQQYKNNKSKGGNFEEGKNVGAEKKGRSGKRAETIQGTQTVDSRYENLESRIFRLETDKADQPREVQRHIEAMFEQFDDKLKGVVEAVADLLEFKVDIKNWLEMYEDTHRSFNFRINALESNN